MKTQKFIFSCMFFLAFVCASFCQEKNDTNSKFLIGKITDSNNRPIKNAIIFLDSVHTNVKTDKEGFYKVELKEDISLVSVFSKKHGLLSADFTGQKKIYFIFPEDSKLIRKKELALLGFRNKTRPSKEEIILDGKQSLSNFRNIYEYIDARVPSVSVSGESISIRGAVASTIQGTTTEPLFLVNGAPVSTISNIAPVDVQSIKVLKDSEASFYGSRAAYGVIKITLKE